MAGFAAFTGFMGVTSQIGGGSFLGVGIGARDGLGPAFTDSATRIVPLFGPKAGGLIEFTGSTSQLVGWRQIRDGS